MGLMAKHIAKGFFPLFFYGQTYLAPFESYLIAIMFLIFGVGPVSFVLAPILVMLSFGYIVYLLGKELKNEEVGFWAMLWILFPSMELFLRSFKTQGYIPEYLLSGAVMFLLTLKILRAKTKILWYLLLGIISGISFWMTLLTVHFILAMGLFLILNFRKIKPIRYLLLTVISFFLIGLPYWIYNIRYNFPSFRFATGGKGDFIIVLHKFIRFDLPNMLSNRLVIIFAFLILFIAFALYSIFHFKKEKVLFLLWSLIPIVLFFYAMPGMYRFAMGHTVRYVSSLYLFISITIGYGAWILNKRFRFFGSVLVLTIVFFNIHTLFKDLPNARKSSREKEDKFRQIVDFLKKEDINNLVVEGRTLREIVFFSNEDIVSMEVRGTNFQPYSDIVQNKVNIAMFGKGLTNDTFKGLCMDFKEWDGFYYNFKRYPYMCKDILSESFSLYSNYCNDIVGWAIDKDFSTYWSSIEPKRKGMYLLIDMGRIYNICKIQFFYNGHIFNLPNRLRLYSSIDGNRWQDVIEIGSPQFIFWSGPRLYWDLYNGRCEIIFKPHNARYIKILEKKDDPRDPFEVNELYIYEYVGEDIFGWDRRALRKVYKFLCTKGVRFVYADFWESAMLKKWGKGRFRVYTPYNKNGFLLKDWRRIVKDIRDVGFIIDISNENSWERLLKDLDISLNRKRIGRYWVYWSNREIENLFGMYWIGIGAVNFLNNIKPAILYNVEFKNGVEFIGFNLRGDRFFRGEQILMEYFWKLDRKINRDTAVFIHFIKDDKVIFQGDYKFLEGYQLDLSFDRRYIYREKPFIKIPLDIPRGSYKVMIGLWDISKRKRIGIVGRPISHIQLCEIEIN